MRTWDRWSHVLFAVLLCLAVAGLAGGGFWACAVAQDDDPADRPPAAVGGLQGGDFVAETGHGVTLTVWVSEVVTATTATALTQFRWDALRFDGAGHPGFVYATMDGNPPTTTVYYAQEQETGWQVDAVGTGTDDAPSLAFDAMDRPHIGYVYAGAVYHAWRDGGVWNTEVVSTGTGPVFTSVIAATSAGAGAAGADITGTVGIAFSVPDAEPPALYLAQTQGGSWSVETVITGTQDGGFPKKWFTGCLDFGYDGAGRPHIGFYVMPFVGIRYPPTDLWHTAKVDGAWHSGLVATNMASCVHAFSQGDPLEGFVAYTRYTRHAIYPDDRAPETNVTGIAADGSVGTPVYTYSGTVNMLQGLASYGGIPQISISSKYRVGTGRDSYQRRELRHLRIGRASLENTLVAVDDYCGGMLAVDSEGEPLIVYKVESSRQFVAARSVAVAYAHAQWLPFVGRGE